MTSTEAVPKELVAMGPYPHHTEPSREESPPASDRVDEPPVPRPPARSDRKRSGAAILFMLLAVAVIALVILL